MNERLKVLIGYDGSECADAALNDLRRAGLPGWAEAVVLSVADVFLPPPVKEGVDDTFPLYVAAGIRAAHERARHAVEEAHTMAAGPRNASANTSPAGRCTWKPAPTRRARR